MENNLIIFNIPTLMFNQEGMRTMSVGVIVEFQITFLSIRIWEQHTLFTVKNAQTFTLPASGSSAPSRKYVYFSCAKI